MSAQIPAKLQNKVAIVTGGGTGIGKGIAKVLIANGATVLINGRRSAPLEQTKAELGQNCHIFVGDVSQEKTCIDLVETCIREYGSVDILVNNAGIEGPSLDILDNCSVDDFDNILNVNVRSQFMMCKAVIPHMKERSAKIKERYPTFEARSAARPHAGAIVNLTSIAGQAGFAGLASYSVSNFGRAGLTRTLALELAEFHVTCNAIAPGIVWTEILDRLMQGMTEEGGCKVDTFREQVETLIPMKTAQLCEDMGEAALYFATAPNTTGQVLAVDGGYLA